MDFFAHHGEWALIFLALFPRLTLLFGSFVSGGFLWWLGWLFAPHLLVAILGIPYFHQNPALVIIAWILAFSGTNLEKHLAKPAGTLLGRFLSGMSHGLRYELRKGPQARPQPKPFIPAPAPSPSGTSTPTRKRRKRRPLFGPPKDLDF